jgi:hypothetical protein
MPWTEVGSPAVIAAEQFNPSIIKQLWLVRNHVMEEMDFEEGCIFTDEIVQVRSPQFRMLVVPPQLQFVATVPAEEQQEVIVQKLGTIVQQLPHTPFKGLGLNFNWHLEPRERDVPGFTRLLFYREDQPLFQNFAVPGSQFGAYLSKDFHGFRLKLDIKPLILQRPGEEPETRVQFAFNFHLDLRENAAAEIVAHLEMWNEARREAERIVDSVEMREVA